jgi:hypothetical protein
MEPEPEVQPRPIAIRELEVLRVAAVERLIIRLPEFTPPEHVKELVDACGMIGLGGRVIVLQYDNATMTVVSASEV